MQTKIYIDSNSLNEVSRKIKLLGVRIDEETKDGLKRAGMKILADAQRNIKKDKSIATGQLLNSGKVTEENGIKVGFESNHAANVEHGQKSGTDVAPSKLVQWLKKKGFYAKGVRGGRAKRGTKFNNAIWAVATKISQNIKQKGTKAKPFLYPALRENEAEVIRILSNAIKKVI